MTMLALGSFLLGAVFGRFFKFWILLPASAVLFAIACANFAILEFAVLATCLQAGYVSGLLFCTIPEIWRRHENPSELPRAAAPSGSLAPASFFKTRHR